MQKKNVLFALLGIEHEGIQLCLSESHAQSSAAFSSVPLNTIVVVVAVVDVVMRANVLDFPTLNVDFFLTFHDISL